MQRRTALTVTGPFAAELDVRAAYVEHVDFVYQSLQRLGVRDELRDLSQEVFAVLSRRRPEFDGSRPLRPWLWGICVGVVRNARRTARRRPTVPLDEAAERRDDRSPLEALAARRRLARAHRALDELDPEPRAVFVMYEVEGLSGDEIAGALGVPLGTVHSRLSLARKRIAAALTEEDA